MMRKSIIASILIQPVSAFGTDGTIVLSCFLPLIVLVMAIFIYYAWKDTCKHADDMEVVYEENTVERIMNPFTYKFLVVKPPPLSPAQWPTSNEDECLETLPLQGRRQHGVLEGDRQDSSMGLVGAAGVGLEMPGQAPSDSTIECLDDTDCAKDFSVDEHSYVNDETSIERNIDRSVRGCSLWTTRLSKHLGKYFGSGPTTVTETRTNTPRDLQSDGRSDHSRQSKYRRRGVRGRLRRNPLSWEQELNLCRRLGLDFPSNKFVNILSNDDIRDMRIARSLKHKAASQVKRQGKVRSFYTASRRVGCVDLWSEQVCRSHYRLLRFHSDVWSNMVSKEKGRLHVTGCEP